jgi:arylsulfatase
MGKKHLVFKAILLIYLVFTCAASAQDKPNILVIWGDDIGQTNRTSTVLPRKV